MSAEDIVSLWSCRVSGSTNLSAPSSLVVSESWGKEVCLDFSFVVELSTDTQPPYLEQLLHCLCKGFVGPGVQVNV